jgi:hypothetical protein
LTDPYSRKVWHAQAAISFKMGNKIMAEGLVFYNLKRKEQNTVYRAKLRRDMYDRFYSDRIEIREF